MASLAFDINLRPLSKDRLYIANFDECSYQIRYPSNLFCDTFYVNKYEGNSTLCAYLTDGYHANFMAKILLLDSRSNDTRTIELKTFNKAPLYVGCLFIVNKLYISVCWRDSGSKSSHYFFDISNMRYMKFDDYLAIYPTPRLLFLENYCDGSRIILDAETGLSYDRKDCVFLHEPELRRELNLTLMLDGGIRRSIKSYVTINEYSCVVVSEAPPYNGGNLLGNCVLLDYDVIKTNKRFNRFMDLFLREKLSRLDRWIPMSEGAIPVHFKL